MRERGREGRRGTGRAVGIAGIVALVALLAAVALPGGTAASSSGTKAKGCTKANTPFKKLGKKAAHRSMTCLVNAERTSRGLRALKSDKRLRNAARSHSKYQYKIDELTHSGPGGNDTGDRIAKKGYEWRTWGENVAFGYETAMSVMKGWMGSAGHCRNILSPDYTDFGFGVKTGRKGAYMTQVFAAEPSDPGPSGGNGPQNSCPQG